MMKYVIALLFAVACAGCDPIPGTPQRTTNEKASVEALFDVDGYRVYRFEDAGRNVYFVLPAHGERVASTAWTTDESCGKGCTKHIPREVVTRLRSGE